MGFRKLVINLTNLVKLKVLKFGHEFNKEVDLTKLVNLEELGFGHKFDQEVDLTNLVSFTLNLPTPDEFAASVSVLLLFFEDFFLLSTVLVAKRERI